MKLGYGSVQLCPEYIQELAADLIDVNLSTPKYDFHCTVIYDEQECDKLRCEIDSTKKFKACIIGIERLGDAIVFDLVSTDLLKEHERLKSYGYKHSFPEFKAHMSVIYDPDNYQSLAANVTLNKWLGREIEFSELTITDID